LGTGATIVVDVGKTLTKLSLWDEAGNQLARVSRPNQRVKADGYFALDAHGIDAWLIHALSQFAESARIARIIPVSHGAAAAILRDGKLAAPPMDYESEIPASVRDAYDKERDLFKESGSPALPQGLNLGAQLAYLQHLRPELLAPGATILTWPQYWSWRLCGVASTEVTSLGCHSDLWRPLQQTYSDLVLRRRWHERLAPVRSSGEILGPILPEIAEATGLPPDAIVYCGVHDSNAALLAARSFPEISQKESTVLSTGTWFVAMRSPARRSDVSIEDLAESRDCLVNVDAHGMPIPSSRFMGGREIELLSGIDTRRIDIVPDQPALVAAVRDVVMSNAHVHPTFTPGVGPFPEKKGAWVREPTDQYARRAAVCLYAAMVANESLNLIGARERILVEGRFAEAQVFVRALASLRPRDQIFTSLAHQDVSFGALRLIDPTLQAQTRLECVEPLEVDIRQYNDAWRAEIDSIEAAR
jgi:sugar (pentulose or hexulose) kinase